MRAIEIDGVSGEDLAHTRRDVCGSRADQEVKMSVHDGPGIDNEPIYLAPLRYPKNKSVLSFLVAKAFVPDILLLMM
jgi:hypothetical protein